MPSHPRPRYRITDATRERTYAEVDGILPFAASHVFESLIGTRQLSCHSFRATTITDLLTQGVPLEDVQHLAGHADPRTTRLYDRRQKQVTRNIVERISV
jgi:integrase